MGCGMSHNHEADVHQSSVSVEVAMQQSLHNTKHSTRHNFVWVRENVNMTDLYDVVDVVGSGSMGEVSIVKKKQDATERIRRTNGRLTLGR